MESVSIGASSDAVGILLKGLAEVEAGPDDGASLGL